jgi:exosortase A-associated hydrolase 1
MTRRHLDFACGMDRLAGTLDHADGKAGLLIVTGGNETRAGAFSGQAQLAASIAAAGFPVFRFDRRGVGDSEGINRGFRDSAHDIAAAVSAFRDAAPQVERVVGFGNCDAASALMLARGAGCDRLVLANPWTFDGEEDAAPAPEAVRQRYAEKLRNPREVLRLLSGKVSFAKLARGLLHAMKPVAPTNTLTRELATGIARFAGPVQFLVASRDRTGLAFEAQWDKRDTRIMRCEDATHAFSEPHARDWLQERLLDALSA